MSLPLLNEADCVLVREFERAVVAHQPFVI
jgi:hypothetical protein